MYAIYTSGSTGQPKGILVTHGAFCNLLAWHLESAHLATSAKTVQFATFGFCVSFQEIFTSWCSGGSLVLLTEAHRRDMEALSGFLENQQIERLHVPFAALRHLAEMAATGNRLPGRLREVISAGEQLQVSPSVARLFERLPGCTLHNQYGASETHVVSAFTLSGSSTRWPGIPPVGRPIKNVEIYLLDADFQPVPPGVAGELYAGDACLPRCYLKDPRQTAQKLLPHPLDNASGARLYRTGDLARYLADGCIEYLGRADTQVKIRGFRLELGEVETLLERHGAVREAAVLAHTGNTNEPRLAAYLVLDEPEDIVVPELRGTLKQKLPEYMVPSSFLVLESFPINANGKLDRAALPVPELSRADLETRFVPPRGPIEEVLAEIWTEVLEIDRVGVEDSFFELGGHSLLATQLISRVKSTFRVDLPLRRLFEATTIAALGQSLVDHETQPGHTEKVALLYQRVRSMAPEEIQARLQASPQEV